MLRKLLLFYIISTLSYVLVSCANVGMPTGGPVDVDPPVLLSASPPMETTNFTEQRITLEFDENIHLENRQAIVISPLLARNPNYTVRGRTLTINFQDEQLEPNTTYIINFADAIRDLNEQNVHHDFQYVFSTGAFIDTLFIAGQVIDKQTSMPVPGIRVFAYNAGDDTSLFRGRPRYMATTDLQGNFYLNYMTEGSFWLYALNDLNNNLRFERNEKAGFFPGEVSPGTDTFYNEIAIFRSLPDSLRILNGIFEEPGFMRILFNMPVGEVTFELPEPENREKQAWLQHRLHPTRDTLSIWTNSEMPDSFSIMVTVDGIRRPVSFRKRNIQPRPIRINSNVDRGTLAPPHRIILNFSSPILAFSDDSLVLYSDEEEILKNSSLQDDLLTLEIDAQFIENQEYRMRIPQGVFRSVLGTENDSFSLHFTVLPVNETGNVHALVNSQSVHPLLVQLVERDTFVVRQVELPAGGGEVDFPYLIPGRYNIRVVEDANNNGIWDSGNIYRRTLPERIFVFPDILTVRPNWDMREVEIEVEF